MEESTSRWIAECNLSKDLKPNWDSLHRDEGIGSMLPVRSRMLLSQEALEDLAGWVVG